MDHATGKEDNTPANSEFIAWLTKINLLAYRPALEDQGFDSKESLVLLTDDEIDELSSAVGMKFGHKKRFPFSIRRISELHKDIQAKVHKLKKETGLWLRQKTYLFFFWNLNRGQVVDDQSGVSSFGI